MPAAALSGPHSDQDFISHRQMDENHDEDIQLIFLLRLKASSFSQTVVLSRHFQFLTAVFLKAYKYEKIIIKKKEETTNHVKSCVAG